MNAASQLGTNSYTTNILHVHFVPEHPEDEPSGHLEDSKPGRSLNLAQPLPVRGQSGGLGPPAHDPGYRAARQTPSDLGPVRPV